MTNPIDAPGTPEDVWRAWPGLEQLPVGGLGSPASVVVLAAHPDDEGRFDLIVLSEILCYFVGSDLGQVLNLTVAALRLGATLLAVHWRHPVQNTHAAATTSTPRWRHGRN